MTIATVVVGRWRMDRYGTHAGTPCAPDKFGGFFLSKFLSGLSD